MQYDFDEIIDRKGTYSLKWDCPDFLKTAGLTERFDAGTIPLFTADMDFRCPQPVIDALHRVVRHGMYGYSAHLCCEEYFTSIMDWFRKRNDWEIHKEHIVYVDGTVEALKLSVLAFSNPGDGVIIQRPVYSPFSSVVENTGRTLMNNQLINNDGYYTMDFEDLESKASCPGTKLLILCSPHNPVGRIWSPGELKRLADICRRNGVIILSDEIHGDLIRRGQKFYPLASLTDYDGIVTCTAVNKTFNLAGLHCTNVVIANKSMREHFAKSIGFILPTPFTIAAVIAAYTNGGDWLAQVNEYIDGNIDWTLSFLKEKMPLVKCRRPDATYIIWMDFRDYGLTPEQIHERIYNRANVVLEGGVMFDPGNGGGFERACLPTRRSLLKDAFNRIAAEF